MAHTVRDTFSDCQGNVQGKQLVAKVGRRGLDIGQSISSRATSLLKMEKYGTAEDGFRSVRTLAKAIADYNPGAYVHNKITDIDGLTSIFKGMFIMLPYAAVSARIDLTFYKYIAIITPLKALH